MRTTGASAWVRAEPCFALQGGLPATAAAVWSGCNQMQSRPGRQLMPRLRCGAAQLHNNISLTCISWRMADF